MGRSMYGRPSRRRYPRQNGVGRGHWWINKKWLLCDITKSHRKLVFALYRVRYPGERFGWTIVPDNLILILKRYCELVIVEVSLNRVLHSGRPRNTCAHELWTGGTGHENNLYRTLACGCGETTHRHHANYEETGENHTKSL